MFAVKALGSAQKEAIRGSMPSAQRAVQRRERTFSATSDGFVGMPAEPFYVKKVYFDVNIR